MSLSLSLWLHTHTHTHGALITAWLLAIWEQALYWNNYNSLLLFSWTWENLNKLGCRWASNLFVKSFRVQPTLHSFALICISTVYYFRSLGLLCVCVLCVMNDYVCACTCSLFIVVLCPWDSIWHVVSAKQFLMLNTRSSSQMTCRYPLHTKVHIKGKTFSRGDKKWNKNKQR